MSSAYTPELARVNFCALERDKRAIGARSHSTTATFRDDNAFVAAIWALRVANTYIRLLGCFIGRGRIVVVVVRANARMQTQNVERCRARQRSDLAR